MSCHWILAVLQIMLLAGARVSAGDVEREGEVAAPGIDATGKFTGEVLPVFYVSDSRESVAFYEKLGFEVSYYHDYDTGNRLPNWEKDVPPRYIEMNAGVLKFALHLIREGETPEVDGMKHYFGVHDVDAHHALVNGNGISASQIYDRPWMRMFYVQDPDGHVLFFFTRPADWE